LKRNTARAMSQENVEGPAEKPSGRVLAEISTELVQLHHRLYGKGPTKAKSYVVDDTVVCLLRGGLTPAEQTLVDEDDATAVRRLRGDLHKAMEEPAKAIVSKATGRNVIARISQVQPDADLAVEVFVLEPPPERG
jgi:uncharacterized protein YbcI